VTDPTGSDDREIAPIAKPYLNQWKRIDTRPWRTLLHAIRRIDSPRRGHHSLPMRHQGRKLGLLLSAAPDRPGFNHGVKLAEIALAEGVAVFCYCIDEAVAGIHKEEIQSLRRSGMKLHVCAYGAEKRGISLDDSATFSGLAVVSDLIANTDRFVSFN